MTDSVNSRDGDSAVPDIRIVIDQESSFPPIRRIAATQVFTWLALGWSDFRKKPLVGILYGLCFAAMGGSLKLVLAHTPQYLSALTCGFLLIGSLMALGLYDVSRRIENQKDNMINSVFSMQGRWSNIGILALVLAVIMLVWARASLVVFALFYDKGMPTMHNFLQQLFTITNWEFIAVYICVGFVFATIVFAITWVSIPLMLDRNTDAITAMIISVVALFANIPLTILWSLSIVGLVTIGLMTWNLGLIIAMPIVGHATWHAYREVVGINEE